MMSALLLPALVIALATFSKVPDLLSSTGEICTAAAFTIDFLKIMIVGLHCPGMDHECIFVTVYQLNI